MAVKKSEELSGREKIRSPLFYKSGFGWSVIASNRRLLTLSLKCFNSHSIIFYYFIIILLDHKSWKGTEDLLDCPSIEDVEWSCSENKALKEQYVRVSYLLASRVLNANTEMVFKIIDGLNTLPFSCEGRFVGKVCKVLS